MPGRVSSRLNDATSLKAGNNGTRTNIVRPCLGVSSPVILHRTSRTATIPAITRGGCTKAEPLSAMRTRTGNYRRRRTAINFNSSAEKLTHLSVIIRNRRGKTRHLRYWRRYLCITAICQWQQPRKERRIHNDAGSYICHKKYLKNGSAVVTRVCAQLRCEAASATITKILAFLSQIKLSNRIFSKTVLQQKARCLFCWPLHKNVLNKTCK